MVVGPIPTLATRFYITPSAVVLSPYRALHRESPCNASSKTNGFFVFPSLHDHNHSGVPGGSPAARPFPSDERHPMHTNSDVQLAHRLAPTVDLRKQPGGAWRTRQIDFPRQRIRPQRALPGCCEACPSDLYENPQRPDVRQPYPSSKTWLFRHTDTVPEERTTLPYPVSPTVTKVPSKRSS